MKRSLQFLEEKREEIMERKNLDKLKSEFQSLYTNVIEREYKEME